MVSPMNTMRRGPNFCIKKPFQRAQQSSLEPAESEGPGYLTRTPAEGVPHHGTPYRQTSKEGHVAYSHDQRAQTGHKPAAEHAPYPAVNLRDAGNAHKQNARGQDKQAGEHHDAGAFNFINDSCIDRASRTLALQFLGAGRLWRSDISII